MPVSEKQKGYARKWDKENMHTISTRVRMEEFKDYKAWCEMRGVTVTSEIKRFVMGELDKYYAELDRLHEEEMKNKNRKFSKSDELLEQVDDESSSEELLDNLKDSEK